MFHLSKGFHFGRTKDGKFKIALKTADGEKFIAQLSVDLEDFASAIASMFECNDYTCGSAVETFFNALDKHNVEIPSTPIEGCQDLLAKISAMKVNIAKDRDKLRDIIGDAETIADSCDSAVQDLGSAADSLSQYV